MLKDLFIQNLILMDSCTLELDPKLNIITGETGSGKTAILHALKLLLGQKLDSSLIRRGEKKGFVQGRFEHSSSPELTAILVEAGIPLEDSSLLLAREISIEGKSKSWVNDRLVSLSLLQKIGSYLIQIVDQNSCQELRSSDSQRDIVDLFGSLKEKVKQFSHLFTELKEVALLEKTLLEQERQRERELSFCLDQLSELNSMDLQEGDEERFFAEYLAALQAEETSIHIDELFDLLSQNSHSTLSSLTKANSLCKRLSSTHSSFEDCASLLHTATLSIQETLHLLRGALSHFDPDPKRKEALDEKLKAIDQMKKKYGASLEEWKLYQVDLEKKIDTFHQIEEIKEKNALRKKQVEEAISSLSILLTQERKKAASNLEKKLTLEIRKLNMSHASLEIRVSSQQRTSSGEDSIHFWIAANQGEGASLVKESSSGGELSRLLLSIKLCLAEKNGTPTLIFDEIDAGVGGETARLIGEKLKSLSLYRQILCITHFPQVACEADLHLRVHKCSLEERTRAIVQQLDHSLREAELMRMLGGEKTLSFYENS